MMRLRKEATADARYMKRLTMQVEPEESATMCVKRISVQYLVQRAFIL